MSMASDPVMALLIIHPKTIDQAVWEEGWRDGQDFLIRTNDTSYLTRDIFKESLTSVFLKSVEAVRELLDLHDFPAVFLCENCSSHSDEEIVQAFASHNIKLLTFPPHTSNMFQPLDLVTFGILKREIQVKLPAESQLWRIVRTTEADQRSQ
jgi:hypothetical protein